MQKFLAQENADLAEADWKVSCTRFALNAPEQNLTEDVWLKGKTYLCTQFALNKTFAKLNAASPPFCKHSSLLRRSSAGTGQRNK